MRESAGLPRIESDTDKFLSALGRTGIGSQIRLGTTTTPNSKTKTTIGLEQRIPNVPQEVPDLSYLSTPKEVDTRLQMHQVPKGSKLGRAYHANPYHVQQLENSFGIDFLKDVFNLGV